MTSHTARWQESWCARCQERISDVLIIYKPDRGASKRKSKPLQVDCSFTPASCSEPCPFRLPRTLEASQRKMHSKVLDLGRSPHPCVCSTATEIPSTTIGGQGTNVWNHAWPSGRPAGCCREIPSAPGGQVYTWPCRPLALWMLIDFAAGGPSPPRK